MHPPSHKAMEGEDKPLEQFANSINLTVIKTEGFTLSLAKCTLKTEEVIPRDIYLEGLIINEGKIYIVFCILNVVFCI